MKRTLITLILAIAAFAQLNAQVAIVANKSVPSSSATLSLVVEIYTLNSKTWSDGSRIVVFDQKGNISSQFYAAIGKSGLELKKSWLRMQLTGEAKAPESVDNDDHVLQKVASTPGAIGYVAADKATRDVKVLLTLN